MTNETAVSRSNRKTLKGLVVSNCQSKTIVVRVDRLAKHKKYKKVIKVSKKYYAHDEENVANVGDTVSIMETRPLSKLKRWRLVEIVQQGK